MNTTKWFEPEAASGIIPVDEKAMDPNAWQAYQAYTNRINAGKHAAELTSFDFKPWRT